MVVQTLLPCVRFCFAFLGLELLLLRRYQLSEKEAKETSDALSRLLRFNPKERWSALDLLRSGWLRAEAKRSSISSIIACLPP